jgi:hypothetical protein
MKRLISSALLLSLALILVNSTSRGRANKNLNRSEDFILFTGELVPTMIGCEIQGLHLYAYDPSGFHAIPFQIDKRDSEGRFVFPNETIRDPLRDGTYLDSNDEMVFMIWDVGVRATEKASVKGVEKVVEIEINDPLDGARAWVYLFYRPGADPPATEDYISHREEAGEEFIKSDYYDLRIQLNRIGMHYLSLRKPDGNWGEDILEGQRFGIKATLLHGAIPIRFPEQEITKRIIGVTDGPVRIIRGVLGHIKVKGIGLEMMNETCYLYYPNGTVSPINLTIPVPISRLFLNLEAYMAMSYTDSIVGSSYINPSNPQGVSLDGKPDPEIDEISDNPYVMVKGPQGAIIDIADKGDFERYQIIRTTLVRDTLYEKGSNKGGDGEITAGFWFRNTGKIPKGTYNYTIYHYFPYPFTEQKPQELLNMIEHPLQLNIQSFSLD